MNKTHESIRDVWEFEKYLSTKPEVWFAEAVNLRNSAEALFLYDDKLYNDVFNKKQQPQLSAFFSARVERMLMGFSLENLVKALLLQDIEKVKNVFHKDGNLRWGKDGHNLLKLFKEARINTDSTEKTFLELWQTCAIWAGRYPLPVNENDLPRKHKPIPSHAALHRRTKKRIEQSIKEGDQLLGAEINDLLHCGVGTPEIKLYRALFDKCKIYLKPKMDTDRITL